MEKRAYTMKALFRKCMRGIVPLCKEKETERKGFPIGINRE